MHVHEPSVFLVLASKHLGEVLKRTFDFLNKLGVFVYGGKVYPLVYLFVLHFEHPNKYWDLIDNSDLS